MLDGDAATEEGLADSICAGLLGDVARKVRLIYWTRGPIPIDKGLGVRNKDCSEKMGVAIDLRRSGSRNGLCNRLARCQQLALGVAHDIIGNISADGRACQQQRAA